MVRFVLIRGAIKTVSRAVLTCAIVSDTALFSLSLGNTVSEASIRKNWDPRTGTVVVAGWEVLL